LNSDESFLAFGTSVLFDIFMNGSISVLDL